MGGYLLSDHHNHSPVSAGDSSQGRLDSAIPRVIDHEAIHPKTLGIRKLRIPEWAGIARRILGIFLPSLPI